MSETIVSAFKAHIGWVNVVAVRAEGKPPVPVLTQRIQLAPDGDREVREPYHVAGGWCGPELTRRPANPALVVERGLRRQAVATSRALAKFRHQLSDAGYEWTRAVVLSRRGWMYDSLEDMIGSHAHAQVAECDAVRESLRAALAVNRIDAVDQEEKSIPELAARELGLSPQQCDSLLKGKRPGGARYWSKEERVLALGAWLNRNGR